MLSIAGVRSVFSLHCLEPCRWCPETRGEGICVSWNATVRILFVGDEGGERKSCMGRLGLEKKGDGLASVVLTVAPDSFDSGEERRDE